MMNDMENTNNNAREWLEKNRPEVNRAVGDYAYFNHEESLADLLVAFATQQTAALQKELEQTKKDCDYYIKLSNTYLQSTTEALADTATLRADNSALIEMIKALEGENARLANRTELDPEKVKLLGKII